MNQRRPGHIALLTSGGDAPGMNAAIRAVVRTAHYNGLAVTGSIGGFEGLVNGTFRELGPRDVGNILHRGGTILHSSRCPAFRTAEGRTTAKANLDRAGVDALVVIGGNGSQTGAHLFAVEQGVRVIGVPSTIDNDLGGTDRTIGFETACQTAVEAIDRLRDTASSHDRVFFVEVMGRDAGHIAARCALACGAEYTLVPERQQSIDDIVSVLAKSSASKGSSIIIVAEGDELGGVFTIAERVKERSPHLDTRVSVLGHLQRGGSPVVADRELASLLGNAAVEHLLQGTSNGMVGLRNGHIVFTPYKQALSEKKPLSEEHLRVAGILAI
jgi:6-phosphofructokinase 1